MVVEEERRLELRRAGKNLGENVEALCNGNSLDSTRVTLERTPSSLLYLGDLTLELAIFCNQVRFLVM